MVRAAFAVRRIPMSRTHKFRLQSLDTLHCLIKVVDFKPEKHSIPVRFVIRVTDRAVVMLNLKAVQLHHQHPILFKAFIFPTAMSARAAEQLLIPATTGFDVSYSD